MLINSRNNEISQRFEDLSALQIEVSNNRIKDVHCQLITLEDGKLKSDCNPDDIFSEVQREIFESLIKLIDPNKIFVSERLKELKIKFLNKFFLAGKDLCPISLDKLVEIPLKDLAIIYQEDSPDKFLIFKFSDFKTYIKLKIKNNLPIINPLNNEKFSLKYDLIFIFSQDSYQFKVINFESFYFDNFKQIVDSFVPDIELKIKQELVEKCEQYNVDINDKDKDGNSMLHHAVLRDELELIPILVKQGIDLEAKNLLGHTGLSLAIMHNKIEIISLLIDFEVDIDKYRNQYLPLVVSQSSEMVKKCFAEKYHAEQLFFENTLRTQITKEYLDKRRYRINATYKNKTALHYAVIYGKIESVKLLIENGIDVNAIDKQNKTALHYAVYLKSNICCGIIELLLSAKINTKLLNNQGRCALHEAVLKTNNSFYDQDFLEQNFLEQNLKMIALLVSTQIEVNLVNNAGLNSLNLILQNPLNNYSEKIIELLWQKGIDIDLPDENGNNALIIAIKNNQISLVKKLLEFGAKTDLLKSKIYDKVGCIDSLKRCFGKAPDKILKLQIQGNLQIFPISSQMLKLILPNIESSQDNQKSLLSASIEFDILQARQVQTTEALISKAQTLTIQTPEDEASISMTSKAQTRVALIFEVQTPEDEASISMTSKAQNTATESDCIDNQVRVIEISSKSIARLVLNKNNEIIL